MKVFKYILFIIAIVVIEALLVYGIFYFAGESKIPYVAFSCAVILALIFYLIYGRYIEEVKVKSRAAVLKKYGIRVLTIFIAVICLGAAAIFFTGILLVLNGHL